MMADPSDKNKGVEKGWLPSPKKVGEFVLAVFDFKRTVESMKKQNEQLHEDVKRLQRQVDDQAGQLKTIQQFVQTAIYEHAAMSGERAALSLVQQLLTQERDRE
jgi:hypothetical protein